MLAPSPRSPDLEYRDAYGFLMFDCTRLRASLSPSSCADNWTNRKCLACADCPTGAIHSGRAVQAPPPFYIAPAKVCVRCGESSIRIISQAYCPSCWNRTREVQKGVNRKGDYPRVIAETLHIAHVLLTGEGLMTQFHPTHTPHSHALPRLEQIGRSQYWLEVVVAGETELRAFVERRLPGAEIVDWELMESFAARRDGTI